MSEIRNVREPKPKGINKHNLAVVLLLVVGCIIIISGGVFVYSIYRTYVYGIPCEELPNIEEVRRIVQEHQDKIEEIENTSPGNVWVEINERCEGKGELFIYYDTIATRNKIIDIIGAETFYGVPYRMFNV
ncbi:MAG: hypothetical protein ACFFDI_16595 [Promethearchaeota archaeon]